VRVEKNCCDHSSRAMNRARIKPIESVTQPRAGSGCIGGEKGSGEEKIQESEQAEVSDLIPAWKVIKRADRMRQASIVCENNHSNDKNQKKQADVFHIKSGSGLKPDPLNYFSDLEIDVSSSFLSTCQASRAKVIIPA